MIRFDIAYWTLICTIIVAPLAFGSVEIWSLAVMQTLVSIGVIVYFARSSMGLVKCYCVPGIVPLLLLLLYMVAQALPLPPSILMALSPSAYEVYSSTVWLDSPGDWASLSLFRRGLLLEFFRFASYVGIYVLTVELFTRGSKLKRGAYVVAGFVSLLAVVSIIARFSSGTEILWLRENPWGGNHFGPYINKNHYAGLMGMALFLVNGLFLATSPHIRERGFIRGIVAVLSSPRVSTHVLFGLGALAIFVSIVMSLSRSGIVSMCVSGVLMAALVIKRNKSTKNWILALVSAGTILLAWFGVDSLFDRLGQIVGDDWFLLEGRTIIYLDSLKAASDFILTGAGFGAFSHVYPAYRTLEGTIFVDHLHNDYLEFLVEGGLVFLVLAGWFIIDISRFVMKNLSQRKRGLSVYICYGSSFGILYMLFHSLSDFNFHVGANGLFFFFLLGLTVSSSSTSFRGRKRTSLPKCADKTKYAGMLLALILCAFSTWTSARLLLASSSYGGYMESSKSSGTDVPSLAARSLIQRAVDLDGLNPVYRVRLAGEKVNAFEFDDSAVEIQTALRSSPLCGACLQHMAILADMTGDYQISQSYFDASLRYGARWTDKYLRYATWLSGADQRDEGLIVFGRGMEAEPLRADEYMETMVERGYSDLEINRILPERYEAMLAFVRIFAFSRDTVIAEEVLDKSFSLLKKSERPKASDYSTIYYLNMQMKRYERAYEVIVEGASLFVDNSNLQAALGRELERRNDSEKALEIYKKVLLLDPTNVTAIRGMERLSR